MTGRDKPFTPKKLRIRNTDRMASAREIIRRGFGHFGRRRKLVVDDHDDTNDYDTLHTDLARRMREYTEHGTEAIRFLLDVMTDADPDDPYSWHHRVSAALELTRRGWDTNYDAITPEMLQDYWRDQHSTRLSVGHKKHLAGLPAFVDDYDSYDTTDYAAIAADLREQEDLEAAQSPFPLRGKSLPLAKAGVRKGEDTPASNPSQNNASIPSRRSCRSRNPEGPGPGKEAANPFVLSPVLSSSKSTALPPRSGDGSRRMGETAANMSPLPTGDEPAPAKAGGWGEGKEDHQTLHPLHPCQFPSTSTTNLDCYYEPLNPNDQAIFDYELRLESTDSRESEVTFTPPSPAAWRDYDLALAHLKGAAASEGVPLLPNPLAGTLSLPNIRSP